MTTIIFALMALVVVLGAAELSLKDSDDVKIVTKLEWLSVLDSFFWTTLIVLAAVLIGRFAL